MPRCTLCALVAAALATGCGSSGPVAVTGAVTLNGKPVGTGEPGTIRFEPLDPAAGQAAEGAVVDGRYEAKVFPGPYTVTVTWYKHLNKPADPALYGPGGDEKATEQLVPVKYTRTGALTADVSHLTPEVDFELSTK